MTSNQLKVRCGRCGKMKPRTEFYKSKKRNSGVQWYCKTCFPDMVRSPKKKLVQYPDLKNKMANRKFRKRA